MVRHRRRCKLRWGIALTLTQAHEDLAEPVTGNCGEAASLRVRRVAYDGVTLQIANADPVMLKEPRMNMKLDIR